MKKLLALLLTLLLAFSSFGTTIAEEILTYDAEITYGYPDNPYGPMVAGLIKVPVAPEGMELSGNLVVYTPESSYPCVDTLVVLAPDGVTGEEMAKDSQWTAVADEQEICVVFIEAPGGSWNLQAPAAQTAFIEAALNTYVGGKLFVDWNERALYVVGYGEGGTMAHELAMAYPARYAGIVSVGGSAVPDAYIEEIGSTPAYVYVETGDYTVDERWINSDFPVPAWIISCGDEANPNVAEYWKKANKVVDEGLTNAYGKVFQADRLTTENLNNEQPIAELWLSDIEGAMTYSADFNTEIWVNFLSRVRRFVGDPGSSLRAGFEPEDLGMKKFSIEVDGLERQFYVYTPSTYDGSTELPLVVCIHGYSSTARAFTTDTEWWRVAESRGLITVYVQAYPHTGNNVPRWTGTSTEFDTNFIRAVVEFMDENYAVDATRRYVTGHSNGGQMTCAVVDVLPELFAAAAPIGGHDIAPFGGDPNVFNDAVKIALTTYVGDHDYFGSGFDTFDGDDEQLKKWANINGLDLETAPITRVLNGRFDAKTVYDASMIPMLKFVYINDSPHAYFPEIAWKVWDETFSKFTRAEDGTLYYEGIAVE